MDQKSQLISSILGPVRPTSSHDRKSRVRDAVKLFDSKTEPTSSRRGSSANAARKVSAKSPKTGAGEAMALEDTGGHGGHGGRPQNNR